MYNGDDILKHNADRKLNILKGFKETEEFFEKGHMDFSGGGNPKGNLQKKQITDKNGDQTTRWVKNGQDEEADKSSDNSQGFGGGNTESDDDGTGSAQDKENGKGNPTINVGKTDTTNSTINNANPAEKNQVAGDMSQEAKTSEQHAQETSDEDLMSYIKANPDGEHTAAAQAELDNRNGGRQSEGGDDLGQGGDGAIPDWDDHEGIKNYLASNPNVKERMMALISEDLFLPPISAFKQAVGEGGGNSETHAHLDAAQQALDAAKAASGHPDADGVEEGQSDFSQVSDEELYDSIDYLVSSDKMAEPLYQQTMAEFKKRGGHVEDWMIPEDGADYDDDGVEEDGVDFDTKGTFSSEEWGDISITEVYANNSNEMVVEFEDSEGDFYQLPLTDFKKEFNIDSNKQETGNDDGADDSDSFEAKQLADQKKRQSGGGKQSGWKR